MPAAGSKIFISYSHEDEKWKDLVVKFLMAYGEAEKDQFDPWVDDRIKLGDDWFEEIERGMNDANIALLLLSADFLTSVFIKREELVKLMARRKADGLRVIPIALRPCPWKSWPSLDTKQVWPDPDRPLSKMRGPEREEALTQLANDLASLIKVRKPGRAGTPASGSPARSWESKLEGLLLRTVCSNLEDEDRTKGMRRVMAYLRRETGLEGEELFRAGRFLVEYRLLMAQDSPHCSAAADEERPFADGQEDLRAALKDHGREARNTAPFLSPRLETTPGEFLQRAAERAADWSGYFMALESPEIAGLKGKEVRTLCLIEIGGGALAPQYLLAGLMSHFHSEWKPVISGYTYPTRRPGGAGMLERLQASQWICWLVWGPSIPLCSCTHWQPVCAYQLGYGDENNSLPAYVTEKADSVRALLADQVSRGKQAVEVDTIVGRLTWGPSAFADAGAFAKAQARLTMPADEAAERAEEQAANGLLFDVAGVEPREAEDNEPAYFTAYIWLMFWIARPAGQGSLPLRLNGRSLPEVGDVDANRDRVRKERLWEDLLPVFVHANILDPVVLRFQKGMLIENAVHLLKRIWEESPGLQFHLVCASDYPGCGCPVSFASQPGETFLELLRARLQALPEKDRAFAGSVRLPQANEPAEARPLAYRAFFSACHLPEMVQGYYSWLYDLMKRLQKAGK